VLVPQGHDLKSSTILRGANTAIPQFLKQPGVKVPAHLVKPEPLERDCGGRSDWGHGSFRHSNVEHRSRRLFQLAQLPRKLKVDVFLADGFFPHRRPEPNFKFLYTFLNDDLRSTGTGGDDHAAAVLEPLRL